MPDDVVVNLHRNLTAQESILLNLQRTCEVSIDLALHVVRKRRFGVPQDSRDAFQLLQDYASGTSLRHSRMSGNPGSL